MNTDKTASPILVVSLWLLLWALVLWLWWDHSRLKREVGRLSDLEVQQVKLLEKQRDVIQGLIATDTMIVDTLKEHSKWHESNAVPLSVRFGTNRSFVVYGTNWQKQTLKFRLYLPDE